VRDGKYARVERERRFLLAGAPPASAGTAVRQITDRYLTGTRLRLRRIDYPGGGTSEFKLTQKVPAGLPGPVRGLITNIYLSGAEYEVFASLPGAVLRKTRVGGQPLVTDIFSPPLHGLVLAESEFGSDDEAAAFRPACDVVAEVTDDVRFTGGRLALTERSELLGWLADYGVSMPPAAAG
jgi:CYTH domain-containing protein